MCLDFGGNSLLNTEVDVRSFIPAQFLYNDIIPYITILFNYRLSTFFLLITTS